MGIGGGIFLIAFGAILTFAIHAHVNWIDLRVVGWVFIGAGVAVMLLTIYFWNHRRNRGQLTLTEQAQFVHDPDGAITPDPPDSGMPPGPMN
jgi:hypothetical protein